MPDLREHGLTPLAEMPELAHAARGIPLYRRDRTIRAYAMVDALDWEELSQERWFQNNTGYAARSASRKGGVPGRTVLLHRVVMGLGPDDPRHVDHINGDRRDNRRANLRFATQALNCQNIVGRKGTTTPRGVTYIKARRKWQARAQLHGVEHYLGLYETEAEAAAVAAEWRREHMPYATN